MILASASATGVLVVVLDSVPELAFPTDANVRTISDDDDCTLRAAGLEAVKSRDVLRSAAIIELWSGVVVMGKATTGTFRTAALEVRSL